MKEIGRLCSVFAGARGMGLENATAEDSRWCDVGGFISGIFTPDGRQSISQDCVL